MRVDPAFLSEDAGRRAAPLRSGARGAGGESARRGPGGAGWDAGARAPAARHPGERRQRGARTGSGAALVLQPHGRRGCRVRDAPPPRAPGLCAGRRRLRVRVPRWDREDGGAPRRSAPGVGLRSPPRRPGAPRRDLSLRPRWLCARGSPNPRSRCWPGRPAPRLPGFPPTRGGAGCVTRAGRRQREQIYAPSPRQGAGDHGDRESRAKEEGTGGSGGVVCFETL